MYSEDWSVLLVVLLGIFAFFLSGLSPGSLGDFSHPVSGECSSYGGGEAAAEPLVGSSRGGGGNRFWNYDTGGNGGTDNHGNSGLLW